MSLKIIIALAVIWLLVVAVCCAFLSVCKIDNEDDYKVEDD